jgi:D-amino-acid dehydrogenase
MHAVVIGAGVIGSSIALQLKRLGHDVTVVDRNSAAGMNPIFYGKSLKI